MVKLVEKVTPRRSVWVFRKAGHRPGAPQAGYNVDAFYARLPELIRRISRARNRDKGDRLRYGVPAGAFQNEVDFVVRELFAEHRLRQGWGVAELALTGPTDIAKAPDDWIADYLFASWKYWSGIEADAFSGSVAQVAERLAPEARRASGRYGIVSRMLRMSVGDLIFVPNTTDSWQDEDGFAVVELGGRYRFEDRSGQDPGTWARDFGHILPVTRVATYRERLSFGAYQRAVNGPIRSEDRRRFVEALRRLGYLGSTGVGEEPACGHGR